MWLIRLTKVKTPPRKNALEPPSPPPSAACVRSCLLWRIMLLSLPASLYTRVWSWVGGCAAWSAGGRAGGVACAGTGGVQCNGSACRCCGSPSRLPACRGLRTPPRHPAAYPAAGFIPSAPGCILHPGYSQRLMIAFGLGAFCTQDSIFVSGCISFLFGCTTWVHFLFCIRSRLLLGALTAAAVTCCEKIMDLNWMGGAHKPEILARRIQMRDPDPHTIHYSH